MFNANDSSMNGTCNTYVQYSAQKTVNLTATKSDGARAQCNTIQVSEYLNKVLLLLLLLLLQI